MACSTKTFTCIQCPCGCLLEVDVDEGQVVYVRGYTCPRGKVYGAKEALAHERTVTSLMNVEGSPWPISVKTSQPVPKDKVFDVLEEIRFTTLTPPVISGEVVLEDVAHTGIQVVATSSTDDWPL